MGENTVNLGTTVNTVVMPPAILAPYQTEETIRFGHSLPTSTSAANTATAVFYAIRPADSSTGICYVPDSVDQFADHFIKLAKILTTPSLWPEGAEGPSESAGRVARLVLSQFKEFDLVPTKVVASAEGGVAICVVRGERYSDVECLNSGEILAVNSDKKNLPDVWEIKRETNDLALSLSRIRTFVNK
jgi:hypothetical protein